VGLVSSEAELTSLVDGLDLVDHHCHAVIGRDLDRADFELLLGESGWPAPAGCSSFDTSLGLAVRAWCAPFLELPAGIDAATYLARRAELGAAEVNARLLAGVGSDLLVDTGYRSSELTSLRQLGDWAGALVHEIARLETMAESVAESISGPGAGVDLASGPAGYADAFAEAVAARPAVVGWKSVAAYRGGLNLDWRRPTPAEVREAAGEWLSAGPSHGPAGPRWRLEHPVLIRHGVWAALDTGRPVQFHTGFGDTDAYLERSNPTLLSDLVALSADLGTPIMLLHCWPRHREAGYLAQMWPHVYLDVGEALPHVGHHGNTVLAEAVELAPWHKLLYSSDAFGLAELYRLGVVTHRRALVAALGPLAQLGFDHEELTRLATLVTSGNAKRVYSGLSG
jgi:predicted TIM-barrel fold metal-dependent hydrolase